MLPSKNKFVVTKVPAVLKKFVSILRSSKFDRIKNVWQLIEPLTPTIPKIVSGTL